jgi:ankyrin repeat protein
LHIAAQNELPDIVEALLDAGAEIFAAQNGLTPLCIAIILGQFEIARSIILAKPELVSYATELDQSTPLHRASERSEADIVRLLIENGADARRTDTYGQTPVHKAAIYGRVGNLDLLLQSAIPTNDLINVSDHDASTALHCAVERGHYEIVTTLVSRGAYVNQANFAGRTALSIACEDANADIVKYLVELCLTGQQGSFLENLRYLYCGHGNEE